MNVLVTGGAGYIGSHAAKSLYKAGHSPIVLDDLSTGHLWAVRWGPFVRGDIADAKLARETINRYDIKAVMHFAAHASVAESMIRPDKYFENNAVKSFHLLNACHEAGVRLFIFSSTCATYGNPEVLPITEAHPQVPVNPYGESKLFVEKLLNSYGRAFDLRWVTLRYFNAAGADPEGELGESHNPETHILPLAIEATIMPGQPLCIFGDDYATKDGTAVRDFIHVSDLASGHVAALEYLLNGGPSQAFNLGSGDGHSVLELLSSVAEVLGSSPASIRQARRAGDPRALIADASSAQKKLAWSAEHSSLHQIVRDAWRWRTKALVNGAAIGGSSLPHQEYHKPTGRVIA